MGISAGSRTGETHGICQICKDAVLAGTWQHSKKEEPPGQPPPPGTTESSKLSELIKASRKASTKEDKDRPWIKDKNRPWLPNG